MRVPRSLAVILTVLSKELRENLRDRRTIFSALIYGPIFVSVAFAALLAVGMRHDAAAPDAPLRVAVAHGERAPRLLQRLAEDGVTVIRVSLDDAGARAAVTSGRYRRVLVVPKEYATQLKTAAPAPLRLYVDSSRRSDLQATTRLEALITQYGAMLGRLRLLARGIDPLVLSAIAVQSIDVATPESRSVLVLGTLSFFIIVSMLMGGLYLAIDATAGERERRSLEPLLTVPVHREQLIYGKILAACAVMLLALALTVAALTVALRFVGLERFGMSANLSPHSALMLIAYCAPLALPGAALLTLIAALTRSYREAQTYVGLALLLPTLPLVFATLLGLQPSPTLLAVPGLSQHFLILGLLRAEPLTRSAIAVSAGTTLALGVLLTLLAGRLYRRESLLG